MEDPAPEAEASPAADPAREPATPAPVAVVLTRDVEAVGHAHRVLRASPARAEGLIASEDARPATAAEVDLAQPFVITLED